MIFYVYEHWRPDIDQPFYVGKGHGGRAYNFRRNPHYNNVVKKLSNLGMCIEVRLVQSGMTEDAAFELEKDRIVFWRSNGVRLTNKTDGGEGTTGAIVSQITREKNRQHAKRLWQKREHRELIKAKRSNRTYSAEERAVLSAAQKNRFKSPDQLAQVTEHCRRLAEARRGKPGHRQSLESIEKSASKRRGWRASAETRAKQSAAKVGKKRKPFTAETIQRMRLAATMREAKKRSVDLNHCDSL